MANPLLPESIADDTTRALSDIMDGPGSIDLTPLLVSNYDTCPAVLLPFHVERLGLQKFVTPDMPEGAVRSLLKNGRELLQYAGTRYAVRRALESLGINAVITEWFEETPHAETYTYKIKAFVNSNVDIDDVILSAKTQDLAVHLVTAVDRDTVTFELTLGVETDAAFRVGGGIIAHQKFNMQGGL